MRADERPIPRWAAPAVFAVALAVYVLTLQPGVGHGGDVAKFQFLGRVLGIGHPTGYPVYLLISWAFGHLPFGELAWRINLLSALFGAAAAAALVPAMARSGLRLPEARPESRPATVDFPAGPLAPVGALLFALSYTPWSQAIIAEVYTLHALFLAAALWALLAWGEDRRPRTLAVFFVIVGFSFSHHMLMVTALPGFAAYILATDRRAVFSRVPLLGAAGGMVLGALPYSYLFWRTAAGAPYLEGRVSSLGELLDFVSGASFRAEMALGHSGAALGVQLPEVVRHVAAEWTPLGWLLVPLGAVHMARRRPRTALLLGLVAAGDLVFTVSYDIPDFFVYLIPLYMVSAFFAAHCLAAVGEILARRTGRRRAGAAVAIAGLLAAAGLAVANGPAVDRSGEVRDAELTRGILDAVPEPAVLLASQYDVANYLTYYLLVDPRYAGREIYVVRHLTWEELASYLEGSGRLRQIVQGPPDGVPPGLPAYVVAGAAQYQAAGFRLTPVEGSPSPLFRVGPRGERGAPGG